MPSTAASPASGQRTLYLHIGNHKTGSTSIQNYIEENTASLLARGLGVFLENPKEHNPRCGNTSGWITIEKDCLIDGRGARVSRPEVLAARLAATEGTTIVMSAEDFAYLYRPEEMATLKRHLSEYFDHIKVIAYLRRQDQQMLSFHRQGSRARNAPSRAFSGRDFTSLPCRAPHHDHYLDYHRRMTDWSAAFGADNMILRIYEPGRLKQGDALADFLDVLGMESPTESKRYNESDGFERTKIGHLICEAMPQNALSKALRGGTDNRRKALPSRDAARAFYAHYAESNRRLNACFHLSVDASPFQEDFDMYPEAPQDIWTEDSANQAIQHLLARMNELFGHLSPDELKHAATLLESANLALSLKFMTTAAALRPSDPTIQAKIEDYRRRLLTSTRFY